jgi:hypothetical protein
VPVASDHGTTGKKAIYLEHGYEIKHVVTHLGVDYPNRLPFWRYNKPKERRTLYHGIQFMVSGR